MKRIIALVLFATMLFAFVPAASAANDMFTVTILSGEGSAPWYAGQNPQYLTSTGYIGYTGGIKADGTRDEKGISVEIKDNGQIVKDDMAVGKTKDITINLKGSYSAAQEHMYTQYSNNQNQKLWGKAVKIPFTVWDEKANVDVTAQAAVDGQMPTYNLNEYELNYSYNYLDFVLTADNSSETYLISYNFNQGNLGRVKVTVNWTNTDLVVESKDGKYPSMSVVGYVSNTAQYGNYTASYKPQKSEKEIGRLTVNIAAMTQKDRAAIWAAANPDTKVSEDFFVAGGVDLGKLFGSFDVLDLKELEDAISFANNDLNSVSGMSIDVAYYYLENGTKKVAYKSNYTSEDWDKFINEHKGVTLTILTVNGKQYIYDRNDDTADIRLKVFDSNGVAYPAGTIVSIGKVQAQTGSVSALKYSGKDADGKTEYLWDAFLGKSSKYVNTNSAPTYVVDQNNCIVFTIDGLSAFATAAGWYYKGSDKSDVNDTNDAYTYEDIALYYQCQFKTFQLIFNYGKVLEATEFGVYFQNLVRSKAEVVITDNEITWNLGVTDSLPYYLSDYAAMSTSLTEEWTSSNSSVVKVVDAAKGVIKGAKVGSAYIYAKDAAGKFQIFKVTVVDPSVVVEEKEATNTYVVAISSGHLNVRSGPGTNYSKISKLTKGAVVKGTPVAGSTWVQIELDGKTAYVAGKYLGEQ